MRKNSSNGRTPSFSRFQEECGSPCSSGRSIEVAKTSAEAVFVVKGRRVRAWLTSFGISIIPASTRWWQPWAKLRYIPDALVFEEILSVSTHQRCQRMPCECPSSKRRHHLIINTFRRGRRKRCDWKPIRLVLKSSNAELVQEWATKVREAIRMQPQRPSTLLVLINPFGGARRARAIWQHTVWPILDRAGVKCTAIETEREGHAREVVQALSLAELQTYDGIVAVGGDGLFQEVLNGLLGVRGAGGAAGQLAAHLRLGHIPAGSTDAVAFSLNGTRSQATAALHIALGDRTPLDVMRLDMESGGHRYAVCVASYGYMGDLMRLSERLRFLGPARYGIAGAITLLRGRAYNAEVAFLPSDPVLDKARRECRAECEVCGPGSPTRAAGSDARFMTSSRRALDEGGWVNRQGRYKSIMAVVTACRSDMSVNGLAPEAHLADGRLQLVLVRDTSRFHYLRFMASIPRCGVRPEKFSFVEALDCTAVALTPRGPESCWNVDGELLPDNHIAARVHHGLLDVFARGIE
ncbi:g11307 [Coccomyxa elongata]